MQIDAGMAGEVLRSVGNRTTREVGGRRDRGHAHVGPDPHRGHILRHRPPEPNAGVDALGDDVGQAVIDDGLDLDVRVVRQDAAQRGPENGSCRMLVGGDPDGPGRPPAYLGKVDEAGRDLVEARSHGLEEALPGLGRGHAPGGAREQPDAEARLQGTDGLAQRRLRNPELQRPPW